MKKSKEAVVPNTNKSPIILNREPGQNRKERRTVDSVVRRQKYFIKKRKDQELKNDKFDAIAQREDNKRLKAAALRHEKAAKPKEAAKMKTKRLKEVAKVQARANKRRDKRLKDLRK